MAALERLRAWAVEMSDQEVFTEWERMGLGGKQHKVLHVDSATDWDSCLELCECAVALRADMEAISRAARWHGGN